MDLATTILIAVGLAMDATAVSIAKGIAIQSNRQKTGLLMATSFAGSQMIMPSIGWYVGLRFQELIMSADHWIAFGLLSFIGAKMIYDTTKKDKENREQTLSMHSLLTLSVATSIDALMVGVSFAFLQTTILEPILLIGIVTFALSIVGFSFGCGLGRFFGNKIRIVGGLILIAIGFRILLEHTLL